MEATPGRFTWKPGEDANQRDGPGRTPLHHLCQKQQLGPSELFSLRQLLEAGANPDAEDGFGRTPLSLVCMETGNPEAVRLLLEGGADVQAKDEWGRTALHWCCDRGWAEAAAFLMDHGAGLNATTKHGDSPLLWAAKAGRSRLVEMLLAAGCDDSLKNNRDERAVDVAADAFIATLIASQASQQIDAPLMGSVPESASPSDKAKSSAPISLDAGGSSSSTPACGASSHIAGPSNGGSSVPSTSTEERSEPGPEPILGSLRGQGGGTSPLSGPQASSEGDRSALQKDKDGRSPNEAAFSQYKQRGSQTTATGKKLKITLKKKT